MQPDYFSQQKASDDRNAARRSCLAQTAQRAIPTRTNGLADGVVVFGALRRKCLLGFAVQACAMRQERDGAASLLVAAVGSSV